MNRLALTCLLFILAIGSHKGLAAQMYVVMNAPANASLDEDSLRALLTGRRRNWDDGNAAIAILPSRESDDFEPVARGLFDASGRVMQRLWFRVVFSGRANAPIYVDDPSGVVSTVQAQRGALGVMVAEEMPEVPSSLRVVELK